MQVSSRQLIYITLLTVGCFVGVTWVVVTTIRTEAERSRNAMEEVAGTVIDDGVEKIIETASGQSGDVVKGGVEAGNRVIDGLGDAAGSVLGSMRDILHKSNGKPKERRSDSLPRQPSASQPIAKYSPAGMIGDLFSAGQKLTRSLDDVLQEIIQLDEDEEARVGAQIHQIIRQQHSILDEPELSDSLQKLSKPFLLNRKRKSIDYRFFIIDNPQINAFAHVGGYIYVNRGLLDFVENDQELQFVLGHEIAHVDLGHCSQQMSLTARASEALGETGGTLVQLGYQAIALGYSEEKEFEADANSCLVHREVKPAALSMLKRLGTKLEKDIDEVEVEDILGAALKEIDNHFQTHPSTLKRIARIKALR